MGLYAAPSFACSGVLSVVFIFDMRGKWKYTHRGLDSANCAGSLMLAAALSRSQDEQDLLFPLRVVKFASLAGAGLGLFF